MDQGITIGKRKDRVKQYPDTFAEVHVQRVSKIDVKDLQQGLGLLYVRCIRIYIRICTGRNPHPNGKGSPQEERDPQPSPKIQILVKY